LSVTNILGCVTGDGSEGPTVPGASVYSPATAGCAGGLPMGAIEMFAELGDTTSSCVGYEWCTNDEVCGASRRLGFSDSPDYLNSIIPPCDTMLKGCTSNTEQDRIVWGLETYASGRPYIVLTDALSIQQEIAAHGPVVATYAIYGDFQNGTAAIVGDGWRKTRGVYCNVQTSSSGGRRPYNGTRYAGSERQLIGYHAVTIVGWGLERGVPDWETNGDTTVDLPYWIVRNSWSTAWNAENVVNGMSMPGYFKIAFTDPSRDLNTKVYLDNADDGLVGAAIAFMPRVKRVIPRVVREAEVDANPEMREEKLVSQQEEAAMLVSASAPPPFVSGTSTSLPIRCTNPTLEPETKGVNCVRMNVATSTTPQEQQRCFSWTLCFIFVGLTIGVVVACIHVIRRRQK